MGKVNVICGTWGRVKVKKTYWNCEPFTKRAVLHAALLIGLVNEPLLWEYNIWIEIWNLFIFCFSHLTIRFPAKLLLRVFCENNGMLFLKFWRSAGQNQKSSNFKYILHDYQWALVWPLCCIFPVYVSLCANFWFEEWHLGDFYFLPIS